MKDYYQCLNLPHTATVEQIRRAYLDYARNFHPDLHENGAFYIDRFREVQEAYDVLSNPQRRAAYDVQIRQSGFASEAVAQALEATEVERLRKLLSEREAEIAHYRWLAPWHRRTFGLFRRLAGERKNIGLFLTFLGLTVGFIWWANQLAHQEPERFEWRNSEEVMASIKKDLRAGLYEKVIVDANEYVSTKYSPLPFTAPERALLCIERARAKFQLGKDTGAVRDYTLALHFDPTVADRAYAERGIVYQRLEKTDEALADYTTLIQQDPQAVAAYRNRAMLLYTKTRYAEALEDYKILCRLQPMAPGFRKMLGSCYRLLGQQVEACRQWRQAASEGSMEAADSANWYCPATSPPNQAAH